MDKEQARFELYKLMLNHTVEMEKDRGHKIQYIFENQFCRNFVFSKARELSIEALEYYEKGKRSNR
jgi:hypothetical protein